MIELLGVTWSRFQTNVQKLIVGILVIATLGALADYQFMSSSAKIAQLAIEKGIHPFQSIGLVISALSILVVHILLGILACSYCVQVYQGQSAGEALSRSPRYLLPLLQCFLWAFIRSLIWIPLIGVITGALLLPRLILAPILVLTGDSTPFQSIRESLNLTKNRWIWTVSLLLIYTVITVVILSITQILMENLLTSIPSLWHWIRLIVWQSIVAYGWGLLYELKSSYTNPTSI